MRKALILLLILLTLCGCGSSKVTSFDGKDRPSSRGKLQVVNNQLCGEDGQPIILRGISTYGLPMAERYVNEDTVKEISSKMGANVIRYAMYTYGVGVVGYCTGGDKNRLRQTVENGVEYAKNADMYAIIDWHILDDGDPNKYIDEAKDFFATEAEKFKDYDNIIYEICNEPNHVEWPTIKKYAEVKGAFFIFDEQRVVGYGAWVKAFLKIAKSNNWVLLSATPGDTWSDYIPVFIANGFYRNKRDFTERHIVYDTYITKYPKIDHYISQGVLMKHRRDIVVNMEYLKSTVPHDEYVYVPFDKVLIKHIMKDRWDPYKDEPIQESGSLCYILRRAVNDDERRYCAVASLLATHPKAIIFYNFDYELEGLRKLMKRNAIPYGEWNGHNHEPIPEGDKWAYLVQYTAGAEGWNCVETNTIIFFSQNYSYKVMVQSAGRIDRLNTPFKDLYYFHLLSHSPIDMAIRQALDRKEDFNERTFNG